MKISLSSTVVTATFIAISFFVSLGVETKPHQRVSELPKKIARLKELLTSLRDRTKQTIEQLEEIAPEVTICITHEHEDKDAHAKLHTKNPKTFYVYMAKLKKAFALFLANPLMASRKKTKVLIIRDIALGDRVQKEMEIYTGADVSHQMAKAVQKIKLVETVCRPKTSGGSATPPPVRLYNVFLRIYRTLRINSKTLLGKRFVTDHMERIKPKM